MKVAQASLLWFVSEACQMSTNTREPRSGEQKLYDYVNAVNRQMATVFTTTYHTKAAKSKATLISQLCGELQLVACL